MPGSLLSSEGLWPVNEKNRELIKKAEQMGKLEKL